MRKILIVLSLVLIISLSLTSCGFLVPRPEIKEGRFNFSITYEINGEVNTFSAVYVCEFDGTSWSLDGGYSRDWADRVEADYVGDDYSAVVGTTDDGGDIILFFGIYPEYFMGDSTADREAPEPQIYVSFTISEDEVSTVGDPEEVEALYGIRIISCEYDPPVQNTFKRFDFS